MAHCHKISGVLGCDGIKGSHSTLNLVAKDPLEYLNQGRATLPDRQNLQLITNLKNRN